MASTNKSNFKNNKFNHRQPQKNKRQKLHKAYYSAANVLWQLNKKSGSLNSLMDQFQGDKCIKMIYALAVKVLKKHTIIEKIMSQLPTYDDQQLNSYLIEILIAELLFGDKSFLKYRLKDEVKYVIDNKNHINQFYNDYQNETNDTENGNQENDSLIRYIRINFLKITKKDFLKKLKDLSFEEKIWSKNKFSFDQFKELAITLNPDQFMIDYHFDDVILFNDKSTKKLTESELYQDGLIAMQDKSSLLAIEAMQLKEEMKIMDACAAPGMKTAAIASRLNNQCTLYANDQHKKRFNDMKMLLSKSGVKFKSITQDFTKLDPSKYPDLDILLLDPSCSGSGINRRLEYKSTINDQESESEIDTKRLEKLAKFQLAILQHALEFNAKKIIYCTCSKYQLENEDVINNLLQLNPELNYEVIDPMPEWPCRGQGDDYKFASKCLRASYDDTLTNGFFCCVLQLKEKSIPDDNGNKSDVSISCPKEQIINGKSNLNDNQTEDTNTPKKTKKRKTNHHKDYSSTSSFTITPIN